MKTAVTFLFAAMVGITSPAFAKTLVYVPTGGANEVLVIDASKDIVIGKVSGVDNSHGLAGTADGKLLIAGSLTETMTGQQKLPAKPAGMSMSEHKSHHSGSAAKTPGKAVSYISVISTSDNSVTRRIEVPGAVHHVAIGPDSSLAVVVHHMAGAISVVDLKNYKVVKTIKTGPSPNYAVISRDGKSVYVSNSGNNTISEVNLEGLTLRRNIEVGEGPGHMILSPDGESLYVNNADAGTVSAVSLKRGKAIRTYPVGGMLHGIDMSDDGRFLFVADREKETLVKVNQQTGKAQSTGLAPSPFHVTAIPGMAKLYVSSMEDRKIWVVDQKTLMTQREIRIPGVGHQMVVAN